MKFRVIIILLFYKIQQEASSYPSDVCYSRSGHRGVCKPLKDCPSAHQDFYRNVFPTPCGFFGWHRNPIICCQSTRRTKSQFVKLEPAPVYENPENDFFGYHSPHKINLPYGGKNPSHRSKPLPVNKPFHQHIPPPVHEDTDEEFYDWGYHFESNRTTDRNKLSGRRKYPDIIKDSGQAKGGGKVFGEKKTSSEDQPPGRIAEQKCSEFLELVCPNFLETNNTTGPLYNQLLVQGEKTREREFPHMAAIGYGDADSVQWLCGGSLISEKFVLTAAHCLVSRRLGPAQWVHLGAERLQDSQRGGNLEDMLGQTHPIVRRIRHPDYRPPSKYNDIALLELGPALKDASLPTMSASVYPACLHVDGDQAVSKATATGWGRIGLGEELSPDLLKVELNIIDQFTCNASYEVEITTTSWLDRGIDSSLICAGELGEAKDTCLGDSGGPLQYITEDSCVHRIIAVTSFGKVCGLGNAPGAYTRVSYFIQWIENNVWPRT